MAKQPKVEPAIRPLGKSDIGAVVRYLGRNGWHFGTLLAVTKAFAKVKHPVTGSHRVPVESVERWTV